MTLDLNWVDYLFITIFAMSFVAGLSRGLIREIVGLIALVAAVVLAVMYSQPLAIHFAGAGADAANAQPLSYIAITTSFLLIFVGVILVGALVGYILNLALGYGMLSAFNRLLGGLFGIVRAAILTLVIMFVVNMTPTADNPQWQASQFVIYMKPAVDRLNEAAAPTMEIIKEKAGNTVNQVHESLDKMTSPPENQEAAPAPESSSEGAPVVEATPEPASEPTPTEPAAQ